MYLKIYPTWDEIKDEVSKEDLFEIVVMAKESGIDKAIQNFIEATYSPEHEYDADAAYDAMRECA